MNLVSAEVAGLQRDIKLVAVRYYQLTGKPLGVTGELAELAAAEMLGLSLCMAREPGFDGWDHSTNPARRIQIKGRAVDPARRYRGRCPSIKCDATFDEVVLVLLDRSTMEPLEIWQANACRIVAALTKPGSKARNQRGSLGISQFKAIATQLWTA